MPSNRIRAIRSTALLLGTLTALLLAGTLGLSKAQGGSGQQGEPKFKNVRLLKNLTHDQLIARMRSFNAALGVECTFCHVRNPDHGGWELDTKPEKRTARQMIVMTEDLNRHSVIKGKATCFMCHHGQHEPQTRPEGGGEGQR